MQEPDTLRSIQRWLQTVITHPDGIRAGMTSTDDRFHNFKAFDVEQVILPSFEMSSDERLAIYGRAYFGRLLECLRAQYPALRQAAGDEAFDGLAFGYLVAHPSRQYTLSALGDSFEAYLAATRPPRSDDSDSSEPDFADFLIDLARLEQLYSVIFDGPGPERCRGLAAEDFAALSPDDFADARLKLHDCVRLKEFRFPVHEYATAVRRGLEPVLLPPRHIYLVITRRDYIVRRYEVTRPQFQVLSAIQKNQSVGEALSQMWTTNPDVSPVDVQTWFRDWSAAPLFAELKREK